MSGRPLRVLELLSDDPKARGLEHGETLRREISEMAEIRMERMCNTSHYKRIKDVVALAHEHIPVLEKFDRSLYLELLGIAEASNNSLERLIVLNHYTDMRDISPGDHPDAGGCSIIYSPTPDGPLLGQTWDIHGSALPYVIMLKFKDALLFSVAGCLGMAGFNASKVGLAINNLSSIDARVGVIWPALVRKALTRPTAAGAVLEIMEAQNGSGRHYALADMERFFSVETSGTKKKIVCEQASERYFHTNHCLDAEMRKTHIIRKDSTTLERYKHLDEVVRLGSLSKALEVFMALEQVSMPFEKSMPHKTATCGTLVMDLAKKSMLACAGIADTELVSWPSSTISLAH